MRVPRREPRTILITGASSGLGAALARELAGRGDRLALTARRGGRLDELVREVVGLGGEAVAIPDDLSDPDAPARIVSAAVGHFGRLDAVVNNAGVGLPRYYADSDPRRLADQVAVNFAAPIALTRLALPYLLATRGTVVNIGSGITIVANPILGVYGATKAGLSYWNDALRRELRHRGVKVCLVELGPVDTEFFDAVRRRAEVEGSAPLGSEPTPDALYNAMRDRPPAWLTTPLAVAARRVADLLDRPRRRLALPRRLIWPLRAVGALFGLAPLLGDMSIGTMIRWAGRDEARGDRRPAGPLTRGRVRPASSGPRPPSR